MKIEIIDLNDKYYGVPQYTIEFSHDNQTFALDYKADYESCKITKSTLDVCFQRFALEKTKEFIDNFYENKGK